MPLHALEQKGFTLIEVLVTLLIFTIGLLGLAGLQLKALQGSTDSMQRSHATWIINDLADRIYANDNATVADYSGAAPNCANLPNPVCADFFNAATNTQVLGTSCSTTQMAAFDRWEAVCRYRDTATYQANATAISTRATGTDFLIAPQLNIAATDTNGDLVNDSLAINLSWQGRGGVSGTAGGDRQSTQLTVRK